MSDPRSLHEPATQPLFRWRAAIVSRLNGPGGLYNFGNGLGFGAGLCVTFLVATHRRTASRKFCRSECDICGKSGRRCAGDRNSDLLLERRSLSSGLVERISARSEIDGASRCLSGFGAIGLGAGLYLLSNPFLAATSGLLHAAGKFGSAFGVRGELLLLGRKIDASALCRNIVLTSRFPAIIATIADLLSTKAHDDRVFAFNAVAMLACYVIWATANSMLLPQDSVVIRFLRGNSARNNAAWRDLS